VSFFSDDRPLAWWNLGSTRVKVYDGSRCLTLFRVGGSFGYKPKMYGDESGYQSNVTN
jgi:hypothetical protein